TNQPLEDDRPAWEGGGEEDEQTGCCAPVCYHVEDCAEAGGLLEVPRRESVEGVEEAGDAVKKGAGRGGGHTDDVWPEEKDVLVDRLGAVKWRRAAAIPGEPL
ncbi:hypothetical protein V492_04797, partial [Pseudogymnoascus sp. VKM F-4246]